MVKDSEVLSGLVPGRLRDGRCRYDPQINQVLVRRCLPPGVAVATGERQASIWRAIHQSEHPPWADSGWGDRARD